MKNPIHSIRDYWNRNITKPLFTSKIIFFVALIIFILGTIIEPRLGLLKDSMGHEIFQNLRGIVFDVAIILFLYNWIEAKRENRLLIQKYLEEIEDFRSWEDTEATYRIRGLIKRLKNLRYKEPIILDHIYFEGGNLAGFDLSGTSLCNANLMGAYLLGANLKGADMRFSYLHGANLSWANLDGAKLELWQLKEVESLDFAKMMDGTQYDDSWSERINQAWEAHERESGTPPE